MTKSRGILNSILKELYGGIVCRLPDGTEITDELIASFSRTETLILSREIEEFLTIKKHSDKLIYGDNPFLSLIDKDPNFQGAAIPVPLKYGDK